MGERHKREQMRSGASVLAYSFAYIFGMRRDRGGSISSRVLSFMRIEF
jgi:hypothetical protein